ncbi:MAG: aminotransferase class IV family protein [Actinobacteria bacterium]|nr:aminotransferase class IV family protein [Actinomycetota bacterium]
MAGTTGAAEVVWLNGALVPADEARISPLDHGLTTGDGVFETIQATRGVPFAYTRHYRRLVHSAEALGLRVPPSETVRAAIDEVLTANALSEARVRVTVTGGLQPLGSERVESPPTVVVAAGPVPRIAPTADVVISPWPRNEKGALTGLKTISYAENVRALAYARERGASEVIFPNTRGELCEGAAVNVFLVRDGVLATPPLSAGCLDGVTRALLIELCPGAGIELREEPIPIGDLASADEAFLTSTLRNLQAIAHVDGQAIPAAPGPITEKLAAAFDALVDADLDP